MTVLLAGTAHAAGLAIRWNTCLGNGGDSNRAFACDTNTGSEQLFASFALPHDISYLPGAYETVIDVATAGASLSPWWNPACRGGSITFTDQSDAHCSEITGGFGVITATFLVAPRGPNTVRFWVRSSLTDRPRFYVTYGGVEYGMIRIDVAHAKSAGADACGGCSTPACIVFNSLRIFGNAFSEPPAFVLTGAGFGPGSDYATWQGGEGVQVGAAIGCPAATPARRSTWGGVKSLYR